MYAQTNIQFFNQLLEKGYSKKELVCIRNAYELAVHLYTGRFQASCKDFLAHGLGTASILSALNLHADIVAAGLIHNIYMNGDFGDVLDAKRKTVKGVVSDAKRNYIRDVLGDEVEEYAYKFNKLQWNPKTIHEIRDNLGALGPIDRNLILIRLADHLEKCLDLGLLYYSDFEEHREFIRRSGYILVEMAQKLGHPTLAAELESAFREILHAEIPAELRSQGNWQRSFVIVPKSYQRRLSIAFYQEFCRGLDYLRHWVRWPHYLRRRLPHRFRLIRPGTGMRER